MKYEKTLAEVSIDALNSALALRAAVMEVGDRYMRAGPLADELGVVVGPESSRKASTCDLLLYAVDVALHPLIDIAGSLNCAGGGVVGAINLSTAPCTASEPMVSSRDDLFRLADAIADEERPSSGIYLFMKGGDSIDD